VRLSLVLALPLALLSTSPSVAHVIRAAGSTPALETIHDFRFGPTDGNLPSAGLAADAQGNLYGTTARGGLSNDGAVFQLTPHGNHYTGRLLYSLGSTAGSNPVSTPNVDSQGNVFGTASLGGGSQSSGTAFELVRLQTGYRFQVLETFDLVNESGDTPLAGLTPDGHGNYFGTASEGGFCLGGTVFELSPAFNVIHDFGCDNNVRTPASAVTLAPDGSIFGTTEFGGDGPCTNGCGIVYQLVPGSSGYTKKTVHSFQNGTDGAYPLSPVLIANNGNIFGTTSAGGPANQGTVYELTPNKSKYTETVVYAFQGATDGNTPLSGLTLDRGKLYGTTMSGGAYNQGTIYKLTPFHGTYSESVAFSFAGATGAYPLGELLLLNNALYGTTSQGGINPKAGTAFRFKP
jgi:uncharacterized repeat protein (TIGR03803 family)